jgi:hypothetical protein
MPTLIDRRFVYRRRIKVSKTDLTSAREQRKTCTIRLGTLGVEGPAVDLTDGHDNLRVRIVSVDNSRFYRDLCERDAHNEGFRTLEELRDDLTKYYGDIDPAQPITIISFESVC